MNRFTFHLAQVWGQDLSFGERSKALGGHNLAEDAGHTEWLFLWITWISIIAFVVVVALMILFAWKYRRRPGVKTIRSPGHNTPLELAWSIIPLVIMAWMFFEGFQGYMNRQVAGAGAVEMTLTARKWSWTLGYPNGAVSTEQWRDPDIDPSQSSPFVIGANKDSGMVFVVPEDTPILLRMHSEDVLHSFWVPDFRVKMDVFPNRYTSFTFRAASLTDADPLHTPPSEEEKAIISEKYQKSLSGPFYDLTYRYRDHYIFCAEYCGDLHSEMSAVIRVVPADVYQQIVEAWSGPGENALPWQKGQFAARKNGCVSCHTWDGSSGQGPTWQGLYGRERTLADGTTVIADDNYIRRSILQPSSQVVSGFTPMPVQNVKESDISDLIAFIRHLSGADSGAEPTGDGG
jgi:cytochrome c oxidase subunit 2